MYCSVNNDSVKDGLCKNSSYFDHQNNVSAYSQANSNEFKITNHDHLSITLDSSQQFSPLDQIVINAFSQNRFSSAAIRQGTLEKCRLADSGVKVKKKEWTSSYAYLYSSHLLFYKDQKSAEVFFMFTAHKIIII